MNYNMSLLCLPLKKTDRSETAYPSGAHEFTSGF